MRHAVQQGVIKHNPAYDLDGVVTPVMTQHYPRPALPLKRVPELLENISHQGQLLTRLALEINLHVFSVTAFRSAGISGFDFFGTI